MTRVSPLTRAVRVVAGVPFLPLVFLWWLLIFSGGPLQRLYSRCLRGGAK